MSDVFLKIKKVKRPISGDEIGFRLQAAIPNSQGGKFDKADDKGNKVSFGRAYLVSESSDYSEVSEADMDRFISGLKFLGFKDMELIG